MQRIKQTIPWAMAAGRALLGPVVLFGDRCGWSGLTLAAMVASAFLSDVFDGVLARRWRVDTAAVRLFDSMCDTVFYVSVGIALFLFQPQLLRGNFNLLYLLLAIEAANFAANFAKFGRPASYHSYLAKAWGAVLASAIAAAFAGGHAVPLLRIALWMGIASNVETIIMSLMLPVWRRDVKTLAAAWRIRKELCGAARNIGAASTTQDCGRFAGLVERTITWLGTAVIAGLSLIATSAFAAQPETATYSGGTAGVAMHTIGSFDTVSATALNFDFKKRDGTAGRIAMDYGAIRGIEPHEEAAHPLGVLPFIVVSLIAHPERRYSVTINYEDTNGVAQVAVFEVTKHEQPILVSIVNARSSRGCTVNRVPCPPALVKR